MNDLNTEVFEYVEKNPEKAISQFQNYLHSLEEPEEILAPKVGNEDQIDFQQYDFNDEEQMENIKKYAPSGARLDKYAM